MKKVYLPLIAFALLTMPLTTSAQLSFVKMEVPEPPQISTEMQVPVEFLMTRALNIHTALTHLPMLKKAQEDLANRKEQLEWANKKFAALRKCNIDNLKDQFKDPEAVWDKMTQTYDQREKDLAIYINSSEPNNAAPKTSMEGYSDQEISEMMLHWSLGNEILTDVYANQDKWGERKAPKSPSFPLWEDQKFFYDKDWNSYYTKLNTTLGAPPNGRPEVGDIKYDYNRATDVKAAHAAYLAKLTAQHPERALLLTDDLKKGPPVPPRPLPPARESVMYLGDVEKTQQVFPAWPEPWKKQIDNGFQNYNAKGEFARDFSGKSFKLKDSVTQMDPLLQNNRLNVYQLQKKAVDGAEKLVEVGQLDVLEMQRMVENDLNRNRVNGNATVDVTDPKNYAALEDALKTEKFKILAEIDNRLKTHPRAGTITQTVAALKKDPSGKAYITTSNAADIDQLLLEAAATSALQKEQEAYMKEYRKEQQKPIDEMCLNGGI